MSWADERVEDEGYEMNNEWHKKGMHCVYAEPAFCDISTISHILLYDF